MLIDFLLAFVLFYAWHMIGITVGYHRLLSHKSFHCPKWVEHFWVLGGYLAFQGSPIWWATMHRAHHRYTDETLDPHSPIYRGWKYAYYGWIKEPGYPAHVDPAVLSKDLIKDPFYLWLESGGRWRHAHKRCAIINLAFRIGLLICFGWVIALANFAAALVVQQIPLLLNVVCHIPKLGYKTYQTNDDSVNVWWVALLTAGEGWHNNHHAFPGSARSGLKMHEIDPSWLTLRFMRALGLVRWINESSRHSDFKLVKTRRSAIPALADVSSSS
jgi:sn-1 stearoyl-lipid 9-desaturase